MVAYVVIIHVCMGRSSVLLRVQSLQARGYLSLYELKALLGRSGKHLACLLSGTHKAAHRQAALWQVLLMLLGRGRRSLDLLFFIGALHSAEAVFFVVRGA